MLFTALLIHMQGAALQHTAYTETFLQGLFEDFINEFDVVFFFFALS